MCIQTPFFPWTFSGPPCQGVVEIPFAPVTLPAPVLSQNLSVRTDNTVCFTLVSLLPRYSYFHLILVAFLIFELKG